MWDMTITLLIVALAAVYVVRRFLAKTHCGPGDSCKRCQRTPQ